MGNSTERRSGNKYSASSHERGTVKGHTGVAQYKNQRDGATSQTRFQDMADASSRTAKINAIQRMIDEHQESEYFFQSEDGLKMPPEGQLSVVQAMRPAVKKEKKTTGKRGGSYFSRSGYSEDQIAQAEEEVGQTSAHGFGSTSSGISNKTKTQEMQLIDVLRKNKEQDYKDTRPKGNEYEQPSLSDFEKAHKQATTTYAGDFDGFIEYTERRELKISDEQWNTLMDLFMTL